MLGYHNHDTSFAVGTSHEKEDLDPYAVEPVGLATRNHDTLK